jgi:hypothetical protein
MLIQNIGRVGVWRFGGSTNVSDNSNVSDKSFRMLLT